MKTMIYFFVVGILLSCSREDKKNYVLTTLTKNFDFVIRSEEDKVVGFESSILKDRIIDLQQAPAKPEVLTADALDFDDWSYSAKPGIKFTKIIMAPYYGLFAYYAIQDLRRHDYAAIVPDCPLNTKYLVIFLHNQQDFPVLGCASLL